MAAARDGSLAIGFGFGKYPNRNVVDGYGGASRGVEQWTVRASRELASDPNRIDVGPLRYEVIEPLKQVRVVLEPNATQPVAFDLVLEGIVPCMLEEREDRRNLHGFRHTANQIRYHQTGSARGWVEVEGKRTEVTPETWIMTRDHSWGIRPDVGVRIPDLAPDPMDGFVPKALAIWNPLFFQRPTAPPTRSISTTCTTADRVSGTSACRAATSTPTGGASRWSASCRSCASTPATSVCSAASSACRWPTAASGC